MAIPDYESCMLPVLQAIADGETYRIGAVTQRVADHFQLTAEERELRLPSGQQTRIANKVGWAKTYLKNAGLVDNPNRGQVRITEVGRRVLAQSPPSIDGGFLRQFPSFVEFTKKHRDNAPEKEQAERVDANEQTPDEAIDEAYDQIREAVASDLLEIVLKASPAFFERVVLDLLLAMGYGGTFPGAGTHMGGVGDGGIDGVIKEDKLGLDIICIQAKRWRDSVGRPVVQAFAGSMEASRAKKGVMITTSTFTRDAYDYIERIGNKIVLINGEQLAQLMLDHDVGVSIARTYTIKKVDFDYFLEDA